jgi:hypothetical protein
MQSQNAHTLIDSAVQDVSLLAVCNPDAKLL